jgi:hypothetical protein
MGRPCGFGGDTDGRAIGAFLTQPIVHAVTARPGLESQELFVSKPFGLLPQSFGGQTPGGG